MTGRDVWRWILPKFDNDVLFHIYKAENITCSGFRSSTIKDIKNHRNRLIANLLDKNNYLRLLSWAKNMPPTPLKDVSIKDQSIEELVETAKEVGVAAVLIKLFHEDQAEKAIQLFSFLQKEEPNLLDSSEKSITADKKEKETVSKMESTVEKVDEPNTPKESEFSKKEKKKLEQLSLKIENLTKELKKQSDNHKEKMEESKRNYQTVSAKLDEKNRLYSALLKEKEQLLNDFETEKDSWKQEREGYENRLSELQNKLNHFHAKQLYDASKGINETPLLPESINESIKNEKTKILVIGKPAHTRYFKSDVLHFEFVEGGSVHDYPFTNDYDIYLILLYELANRDQFLLNTNEHYSKLEKGKVKVCKDFNDVKKELNYHTTEKERVK